MFLLSPNKEEEKKNEEAKNAYTEALTLFQSRQIKQQRDNNTTSPSSSSSSSRIISSSNSSSKNEIQQQSITNKLNTAATLYNLSLLHRKKSQEYIQAVSYAKDAVSLYQDCFHALFSLHDDATKKDNNNNNNNNKKKNKRKKKVEMNLEKKLTQSLQNLATLHLKAKQQQQEEQEEEDGMTSAMQCYQRLYSFLRQSLILPSAQTSTSSTSCTMDTSITSASPTTTIETSDITFTFLTPNEKCRIIVKTLNQLASLHEQKDESEYAIQVYQEALNILHSFLLPPPPPPHDYDKKDNENHHDKMKETNQKMMIINLNKDLASTYLSMGSLYLKLEQFDLALPAVEKAHDCHVVVLQQQQPAPASSSLSSSSSSSPPSTPHTEVERMKVIQTLAILHERTQNYNQAIHFYKLTLQQQQSFHSTTTTTTTITPKEIASTCISLSNVYFYTENYQEALNWNADALQIYTTLYQNEQQQVQKEQSAKKCMIGALENRASLYLHLHQVDDSIECFCQIVTLLQSSSSSSSSSSSDLLLEREKKLSKMWSILGALYVKQGLLEEAMDCFRDKLNLYHSSSSSSSSFDTKERREEIQHCLNCIHDIQIRMKRKNRSGKVSSSPTSVLEFDDGDNGKEEGEEEEEDTLFYEGSVQMHSTPARKKKTDDEEDEEERKSSPPSVSKSLFDVDEEEEEEEEEEETDESIDYTKHHTVKNDGNIEILPYSSRKDDFIVTKKSREIDLAPPSSLSSARLRPVPSSTAPSSSSSSSSSSSYRKQKMTSRQTPRRKNANKLPRKISSSSSLQEEEQEEGNNTQYIAKYDFSGDDDVNDSFISQITFQENDIISVCHDEDGKCKKQVLQVGEDYWWWGRKMNEDSGGYEEGWFPSSYVSQVVEAVSEFWSIPEEKECVLPSVVEIKHRGGMQHVANTKKEEKVADSNSTTTSTISSLRRRGVGEDDTLLGTTLLDDESLLTASLKGGGKDDGDTATLLGVGLLHGEESTVGKYEEDKPCSSPPLSSEIKEVDEETEDEDEEDSIFEGISRAEDPDTSAANLTALGIEIADLSGFDLPVLNETLQKTTDDHKSDNNESSDGNEELQEKPGGGKTTTSQKDKEDMDNLLAQMNVVHCEMEESDVARPFVEIVQVEQKYDDRNGSLTRSSSSSQRGSQRSKWVNHDELLTLADKLRKQKKRFGLAHPVTVKTLASIAMLYKQGGDQERALKLYQEMLRVQQVVFGDESLEVSKTMTALGDMHKAKNELDEAMKYYSKALEIEQRLLGECRPKTLNSIGTIYLENCNFDMAMENFQRAMELQQHQQQECANSSSYSIGNESHKEIPETLVNIGAVYYKERNSLSKIRRKNADNDYQNFIQSGMLVKIARAHEVRGEYIMSMKFYEETLQLLDNHDKMVDSIHDKAYVLNCLGCLSRKTGRYAEALDFHNCALQAQLSSSVDKSSIIIADTRVLIGMVKCQMGHFQEAMQLYEKALSVQKSSSSNDKARSIARTLRSMGTVCVELCNYDKALTLFHDAQKSHEDAHQKDYVETLEIKLQIGKVHSKLGMYDQALQEFTKILVTQKEIFDKNHPVIADTLHLIGKTHARKGELFAAMKNYEECYDIRIKLLGYENPDVASTLNSIGEVHITNKRYEKALRIFEDSLKIRTEALDDESSMDVAQTIVNVGIAFEGLGKTNEAMQNLEKAFALVEAVVGRNHPATASVLFHIGNVLLRKCSFEEAREKFEVSLRIYRSAGLKDDHPKVVKTSRTLERVKREEELCV